VLEVLVDVLVDDVELVDVLLDEVVLELVVEVLVDEVEVDDVELDDVELDDVVVEVLLVLVLLEVLDVVLLLVLEVVDTVVVVAPLVEFERSHWGQPVRMSGVSLTTAWLMPNMFNTKWHSIVFLQTQNRLWVNQHLGGCKDKPGASISFVAVKNSQWHNHGISLSLAFTLCHQCLFAKPNALVTARP
jgi:hypothetical protein